MPWFSRGGVEIAKLNLVSGKQGKLMHEVVCFSKMGPWPKKFEKKGGIIHCLARRGEPQRFWNPMLFLRLLCLVYKLKPDLLVGCMFEGTLYAQLVSRITGIPYFHEDHWDSSAPHGILARWNHRTASRKAEICLTVSKNASKHLEKKLGILKQKICMIRNPCRRFPKNTKTFRATAKKNLGLDPKKPVIGTCSRLDDKHKKISDLIRAVAKIKKPVQLLIIGDGKDRSELEKNAQLTCQNHRVIFAGYRTDHRKFLAAMDIFISVPAFEAMGIAVAEAMSAGLPCVVSGVGGLKELFREQGRHRVGFVLPPSRPDLLKRAISSFLENPKKWKKIGLSGQKRARIMFDETTHRKSMACAYLDAIRRHKIKTGP